MKYIEFFTYHGLGIANFQLKKCLELVWISFDLFELFGSIFVAQIIHHYCIQSHHLFRLDNYFLCLFTKQFLEFYAVTPLSELDFPFRHLTIAECLHYARMFEHEFEYS